MDVRLVIDKGSSKPQTWHLYDKSNVIGRRRDCQLRILSAEVSRRHCLLSIDDEYVHVEDLDSINGTFLNGQRVVGKQPIHPGDRLEVGPVEFIVEYDLTQSARERLAQQTPGVAAADDEREVLAVAADEETSDDAAAEEPFAFAEDDAADWHLPQTSDLRDLLSQVEKPAPERRKR